MFCLAHSKDADGQRWRALPQATQLACGRALPALPLHLLPSLWLAQAEEAGTPCPLQG